MSGPYRSVHWNRQKSIYDRLLIGGVLIAIGLFVAVTSVLRPELTAETLLLRSTSITAVILLHLALAIGPLARLDRRFLPFLYNRRHLGVLIFFLAFVHAALATIQFHALGDANPFVSLFTAYSSDYALGDRISEFPFEPFGVLALAILFLMAATSHDFWLRNLGASFWKLLHSFVYVAYAAMVLHVAFGVFQSERSPIGPAFLGVGFLFLFGLHVAAQQKESRVDRREALAAEAGFVRICSVDDLPTDGSGKTLRAGEERVALFHHEGKIHALSNACRHQGGPIGEGKILDGCVTCPWHGWQYQPEDGKSPPPFHEVIATFPTRVVGREIWVRPVANELGAACPGSAVEGESS